ncbi:hypothetical protein TCAL_04246 [Tigriopus californicus]|uniref:Amine oxidase domain-containing protein n=1 Tax=Tigriopus californicus TaxID=6832 RepID=A0A553PKL4_TIGCA|nr:hypothetical protein TCAL_04246 [Tigriopus californicus]|eukprot:TCALIF_04246-PA protein Name:"Similar to Paox Peroxisomal N(1)-acetyl-spermine/spermidine oxidase (Mus musculus)" AED:0.10 eAED:0.13 QI:0/-1/0/1/-1/1/1/0/409
MEESKLPRTKVVIIGAGASGLAAADALLKNDLKDFMILESSDRIGGRVHSIDWAGTDIELGAQWIHGEEGNVACEIALEHGILEDPKAPTLEDIGEDFFDSHGNEWDEQLVEDIEAIFEQAEDDLEERPVQSEESIGDYFEPKIKELVQDRDDTFRKHVFMYLDFYHRYQQAVEACNHWNQASLYSGHRLYELPPGKESIALKGDHKMSDILDTFLSDELKSKIAIGSEVTQISEDESKAGYKITTKNGKTFLTDAVLVSVSLGVLKAHHPTLFSPPLPKAKVEAIQSVEFGTVNKIYLEFEHPWWSPDAEGFGFLFENDSDYSLTTSKTDWTRSLLGLYLVANRPNILSMWISGHGARYLETLSEQDSQRDTMNFIRKFLHNALGAGFAARYDELYPEIPPQEISRYS